MITPLMGQVFLKLDPEPELSAVIQVMRETEDLVRFAEVLAIGPEVWKAKVGERVLASITAGTEVAGGVLIDQQAVLGLVHE